MRIFRKRYQDQLEKQRLQKTYEGQLLEARRRLEREASERESMAMQKAQLQSQLEEASKPQAEAAAHYVALLVPTAVRGAEGECVKARAGAVAMFDARRRTRA